MITQLSLVEQELKITPITINESQRLSRRIDQLLNLEVDKIESYLNSNDPFKGQMWEQQPWIGLEPELLLTPYSELIEVIEQIDLPEGSRWVDLGAAYGRLGIVLSIYRPNDVFVGYEFIKERQAAGAALFHFLRLSNCTLNLQDLRAEDFVPEAADCYFLYDFGSRLAVKKTLLDLQKIALEKNIIVVARGRGCRNWIHSDHPWLCEVNEPIHTKYYSIYRS